MPIKGRVRVVGSVLVVLADDMALGPPIHWIIFFVVGVIGLGPLINLLDGLPLKRGASYFGICCLDFSSLGILLEDSVSWLKVLFFRVFPFSFAFGYIYLIVALVPFVFGFSVHLLGYHCPLSFGCAI